MSRPMPRFSVPPSSACFPLHIFEQPTVLRRLVRYLDWPSCHAILSTSRDFRKFFFNPAFRNSILARFVPGYDTFQDSAVSQLEGNLLSVDLLQLHLFLVSQSLPVQTYPTHALRFLFSLVPYIDKSEHLVALTQAHSRFVLLLQSLVYTSRDLVFPAEPQHVMYPILSEKLMSLVPELTSPAPLSYKASVPPPPQRNPPLSKSKFKVLSSSTRRLSKSLFKPPQLPPPVAEPFALRAYSSTWKRPILYRNPSEINSQSSLDNDLVPPRRRYVPSTPTSTNSQSSLSRSSTPTPPTSNSSPSPPPSRLRLALSPLSASPYDFIHALSPVRAPVLRSYIPCAAPQSHPQTIIRCEEQLINAGLWAHLSVGDIVANLGHVPLSEEPEKPSNASDKNKQSPSQRPQPSPLQPNNWLLFNGMFLVPFSSQPGAPIPVDDALTLPSPFYYTHILPQLANPIFSLRRMPRFSTVIPSKSNDMTYEEVDEPVEGDIPMRLLYLPARVPITQGGGIALVKRYKWLARVFVNTPRDGELEIGQGWQGEWIVEGEGTKEGREALIDWLLGRGRAQGLPPVEGKGKEREQDRKEIEWEWELVRERCRKGRMWFKLLNVRIAQEGPEIVNADHHDITL